MLPPDEFKTIKQPVGSKVCAACVAAMVVGKSLEEAEAAMEPTTLLDGTHFYRTSEVLKFLGGHGIYCGLTFNEVGRISEEETREIYTVELSMRDRPAILCVRSKKYKNAEHLVFWDGESVRDPSPAAPETSPITNYQVIEIVPLTYIDDSLEIDPDKLLELASESP